MKKVRRKIVVVEDVFEEDFLKLICEAKISPDGTEIDAYSKTGGDQGYVRRIFSLPKPHHIDSDKEDLLTYVRKNVPSELNLIDIS